jgi:RNA polymerase subunit RPABC4/transcription elongation factor Spt4
MQLSNESRVTLSSEISIVPGWAWVLAGIAFVSLQYGFNVIVAREHDAPPAWARPLLGLLMGILLAAYFLFIGYVNRDSKRRGMPRILWTFVAALIPNALGIILYFVLRQPLRSTCPQCGNSVQSGFNFCPQCNYKLGPGCPQCHRVVSLADVYCPYCGTSLQNHPAPAPSVVLR